MTEFVSKPHKRCVERPDGSMVIVRSAYRPCDFQFPDRELEHFAHIRSESGTYGGSEDILDVYDGVLSYYHQIRRFERDGLRWILLQHPDEYAVEVELTRGRLGDIRPLPPAEAWLLARELDRRENRHPIEVEIGSAPA